MADQYLSEMRIFSFNFPPKGWAFCNGQSLAINQNQALFSLLGTTYGGNGTTTFNLPNLQGRVPIHFGTSNVGSTYTIGQTGGEENHTLLSSEIPTHTHNLIASSNSPNINAATNNFLASNTGYLPYSGTKNETMAGTALASIGGGQPHTNMSPYSVLNICIALQGIFPSRN